MNILFLTLARIETIESRDIYTDLMRNLVKRGNRVYIADPIERRFNKPTHIIKAENVEILRVHTLNIQKTNVIEKGIGTLILEYQFDRAIQKQWPDIKFDLVLYSTPPITFNKVIDRIKKRCGARTYLMLKDIFPQNAVDLGMMKKDSALHKLFRKKEKRLYNISDRIGCMSPANVKYVIENNPEVDASKVEICPNAIELVDLPEISESQKKRILNKFGIPSDKKIFVYGGNLGKPQGIDFLLDVISQNEQRRDSYIVVVGNGTEFSHMKKWFDKHSPKNAKLMERLPKDDYDNFIRSCDVGLIFLDPRFKIPNFPSRLLSYLENSMPVLLATDNNTDMGRIAEQEEFGLWALAGDINKFMANMDSLTDERIKVMGAKGRKFLEDNYTVDKVANIILK